MPARTNEHQVSIFYRYIRVIDAGNVKVYSCRFIDLSRSAVSDGTIIASHNYLAIDMHHNAFFLESAPQF